MADGLYKTLLSVVLRQNQNLTTSPTNAFNLSNPAVQNYLTQKLKGILPNASGNITENELMTAWLLANSGGGSGTVTSVDITTNAGAITITGNPITTSGTIDLDFNGAGTDYIDGEGNAQPFPTIPSGTVTSVGLTMPSAFSVAGSPVTTTGTLAVTGAGTTAQYIRGDGSLDTFPTIPTVTPAALSKVDDTNVTLTLGGTPATALLQATSLTLGWSGQLSVARGGTGLSALGTANQLIRVNAGATALEYFTPTYLTGLTVGTTPIASGTVGRILFQGTGNVLQENAILNLDTTNGLIIGGATARGTRQTIVNSANTYATKIFVQRNAADSADYTSIRGDGAIDFNNFSGSTQNTFVTVGGSAILQNYFGTANAAISLGFSNTLTYTGGGVNNIGILGNNNQLISNTGTAFNYTTGNANVMRNCNYSLLIGQYIEINGASRTTVIGGRATSGAARSVTGSDNTVIGYALDPNTLAYTASLTTYFNNSNASHWLHKNGNIGLFGQQHQILSDSTGATGLNNFMNLTATNTITLHSGTETTGNLVDAIQVYSKDITAGNSGLHVWDEIGRVFYAGENVGMQSNHNLQLAANNTVYAVLSTAGRMYVGGSTTPTAVMHLAAGTATASTAPIKLTSGTLLTAPEAGTIEFLTDRLTFTGTTGTTRKDISQLVYRGISALYTLDGSDELVNCTTGTFAVTLPTAVGFTGQYIIKNSGTGVITLNTTSSQTIDGVASGLQTLNQYDAITLRSDGANWIII